MDSSTNKAASRQRRSDNKMVRPFDTLYLTRDERPSNADVASVFSASLFTFSAVFTLKATTSGRTRIYIPFRVDEASSGQAAIHSHSVLFYKKP